MATAPFLVAGRGSPATVATSGDWQTVLVKENLQAVEVKEPQGNPDEDVSITITSLAIPVIKALNPIFSSAQNATLFGRSAQLPVDTLENTAWLGDPSNSGVLALVSPSLNTAKYGLGDLLAAFAITDQTKTPDVSTFISTLLLDTLQASLHPTQGPTDPLNAIWCITTPNAYEVVLKLSFDLSLGSFTAPLGPLANAIAWVNSNLQGIAIKPSDVEAIANELPPILLTLTRTNSYAPQTLNLSQTWQISCQFSIVGFTCIVNFSPLVTRVYIKPSGSNTITAIFTTLKNALFPDTDSPGLDPTQMPTENSGGTGDVFSEFFSHIGLWYVSLETATSDYGSVTLLWGVTLLATWTIQQGPVVVVLSYESRISKFTGRLLLQGDLPDPLDERSPNYERRLGPGEALQGMGVPAEQLPTSINLWQLFTDSGSPPKGIPYLLDAAQVSYQTLPDSSVFTFYMDIAAPSPNDLRSPGDAPSGFVWSDISVLASLTRPKASNTPAAPSTDILIVTTFMLNPRSGSSFDQVVPAELQVSLSYNSTGSSKQWILEGSVTNLSVALLADYFDPSCSNGAMEVLGNLNLASLDMLYTFASQPASSPASSSASSFVITAVLTLGELELDLCYQYASATSNGSQNAAQLKFGSTPPPGVEIVHATSNSSAWVFEAYLRADSPNSTIASVAESIVPGAAAKLPTFVGDIPLAPTYDATVPPIMLSYSGGESTGSLLTVWVGIGDFNLTFIQYRTPVVGTKPGITKCILRISVDQIPLLDEVPLINQLPQPFDHLTYLWVEDDSPGTDLTTKGFTRAMLTGATSATQTTIDINSHLSSQKIPVLQFKDTKATKADTDLLLQAGHHFMIITHGEVVLDHVFETSASETTPTTAPVVTPASGIVSTAAAPATESDAPPTTGNTQSKAGPLSISGLSLQYKSGSLLIGVNASLTLGPMTFEVQGFTVSVELTQIRLNDLSAIITQKLVSVSLHGLGVGVSKPPLTLAGAFVHETGVDASGDSFDSYRGGIAVGFKAWDLLAVGEYRIVTVKSDKSQFKSVFVYGKLDGPLVELEFATISGVRLGFGYNSTVYLPSADLLYTFPFISDTSATGSGNDPMQVLNKMITPGNNVPAYVSPKIGSCWFCAGMTITAFDCITLTAVLMFDVDTTSNGGGAKVALLADGVFQMEPLAPPDFSLFYIEVLIKVELNVVDGYIAADAVLAPASHVYVPQAHLTGGASFYSWFPPSSHAGDWVVTIGGYNRGYSVPSHYPVPARLGLSFTVGDEIQIVGQGYAAVTPKCAMAGGQLHMSLGVGPVSAYCDITLDVFINFKPFYFLAQISLSVGVECDIDILFIHIHISVSIGADLKLWGPNGFGGLAHVDFWFFGFDIHFGDGTPSIPGISLEEFYEMVRTPGPASTPPSTDTTVAVSPYITSHKYTIEAGLFPSTPSSSSTDFPNTGAATEWLVLVANLQVRVDCDFALSSATIINNETDATQNFPVPLPSTATGPLNPIYSFPMHNNTPITSTLEIRIYSLETTPPTLQTSFTAELVLKNASLALWSEYFPQNDPLINPNPPKLQDGTTPTVLLCQAVRIFAPVAVRSKSPIVDFDATVAMRMAFPYTLNAPSPQQTQYLASPLVTPTWPAFTDQWSGKTQPQFQGVDKSAIRGDNETGGMMMLAAQVLGWMARPKSEMTGNVLNVPADGKMPWVLESAPPSILTAELGDYYAALPMGTAAS